MKSRYVIDGSRFGTLEEFAAHFSERVLRDHVWLGNLDAFDDILYGGFGTPEEGFILIWRDSALSRARLGHVETARQLHKRLATCHPSNRGAVATQLQRAQRGDGPTVFDWLLEIIRRHDPAEVDAGGIELLLE